MRFNSEMIFPEKQLAYLFQRNHIRGAAKAGRVTQTFPLSPEVGDEVTKDEPITTNPNVGGFGQVQLDGRVGEGM